MFGTSMPPSVEHSGRFGSGERPETHAAFVADTEGRVLGFVYMQIADAGHCAANVNALFATGDERGHGAGQALLNAALEWCRAHVAHEVSLDCIWPNDLARRFYENRGFRTLLITYVRQLNPATRRASVSPIPPMYQRSLGSWNTPIGIISSEWANHLD